ncbi:hypothetical protein EI77_02911 [Prosthecobacter fusiformis]|uniref:Uncharacterized protein n=1 Tax=Prosthecobacter fusiformis TaxID=48464 RepID=A0A4V3FF29_9BACT|nr:hypothetical protein EI77_02911 [Prosthecobacter fusiformis]
MGSSKKAIHRMIFPGSHLPADNRHASAPARQPSQLLRNSPLKLPQKTERTNKIIINRMSLLHFQMIGMN